MKIVVIGPVYPYRGGIAHHTTLLARALSERHDVLVVSFRRLYPRWLYPGASDQDPSTSPLSVPAEFLLDPLAPWTWWQAAQRIAAFQPARVILPWWTTFLAPMTAGLVFALRRAAVDVCFLIHNVLPHEPRGWDLRLARLALRGGRAFIVHSVREKARLQSLIPEACIQYTPHPRYAVFGEGLLPQAEARQRLGLPLDRVVVLFFGIVRAYKGLHILLPALARLPGPRPYLLVAGEFWEDKTQYLAQIQQLELASDVRLHDGYIPNEDLSLYFSAADIFVAPYVGGTQSGAVQMALGFGLPLVVSDHIAASMSPVDRERATVVPTGNVEALAKALADCSRAVPPRDLAHPPEARWSELVTAIESVSQS